VTTRRYDRLRARLYGWSCSLALWLLWATWRVDPDEIRRVGELLRKNKLIVCFWHGKYIPLFILLRNHDACVFSSDSFRGLVIGTICRHFGYRSVLIPEEGEEAYLRMRDTLATERTAGIAVDGPLGPYHAVKRGPIRLASDTGVPLLAVSVAASRSRVNEQRWDLQEIPRPFSRVCLAAGHPIRVPADLGDDELSRWQERLARELEDVDRRASEDVHGFMSS
jgi:lysophospholipid acyltransferase (LPLAT)-like uncharacterized protein